MSVSSDHETIMRLAMRGARVGTWVCHVPQQRIEWSPELGEIFGLEPAGFPCTDEAFHELVHAEDRPALAQAVQKAIEERTDYVVEFRFRHASGEWRWMDGRGKATYDASGQPLRLYGVGMDITERKRAELTRAHLAAIVESSDDAIVSKTLMGVVTSWNSGAMRLFGHTAEEMIGQSITRIIPSELITEEYEILAKLSKGERIEHFETERVAKDGRRLFVSLSVSPVRDERGVIVGVSKTAHDITERKRTEAALRRIALEREQLLESERAARSEAERLSHVKDEFLATLSHELRTPLNAIQGWATLLRREPLNTEERERGLETIERNVRAQAQIVNDLLDMSRIVSGKIHLEVQPLDVAEVIRAAIEVVRPSAEAKRIRIRQMLDSTVGFTRGDPNRLQQVLWNLLTNAVKFTPAQGYIRVILERVDSQVQITVEDSGAGIKPEFLPYVFERFRQADASTTRRYGGLGLGLSIVKNLVELHGGSVQVKSAGEHQGATFIVSLPISMVQPQDIGIFKSPEAAAHDTLEALELPRLEGITVLVVDDELDARSLVARILEGRGARTVCVASADDALEALGLHQIHILLSDIGMPHADGYELMRRVRALEHATLRRVPGIALTAYARPEDRQRSLLAGFQMHISKPIETRELIAGIASLLKVAR